MATQYELVPGGESCDICEGLQGIYPTRPMVPIHKNCNCTVHEIERDTGDCEEEVRNAESQRSLTGELQVIADGTITPPPDQDLTLTADVELGEVFDSWDHPELREAVDWNPQHGSISIDITIPAGTHEFTVTAEIELEEIIARGDLWEVCRRPEDTSDPNGYAHTINERHIGRVGGGAVARTGVSDVTVDADTTVAERDDGFFEDDDEVPA